MVSRHSPLQAAVPWMSTTGGPSLGPACWRKIRPLRVVDELAVRRREIGGGVNLAETRGDAEADGDEDHERDQGDERPGSQPPSASLGRRRGHRLRAAALQLAANLCQVQIQGLAAGGRDRDARRQKFTWR